LLEAGFGPHGITIDPSSGSRVGAPIRSDGAAIVIDGHPLDLVRKADDESVAVGHLYLRQRPRVHHIVLADDLVEPEEISGRRIDLVASQRPR